MVLPADNTVTIELLDGTQLVLRPTLKTSRAVCAAFGNPPKALEELRTLDPDVYGRMIHACMGLPGKPKDELIQSVYDHGVLDLMGPLTDFLMRLAHGGRKREEPAEEAAAEDSTGNP